MKKKLLLTSLLLVLIAVIFWSSITLQTMFESTVSVLESYIVTNPVWGVSLFLWLAAASAVLSPFSSVVLVPFVVPVFGVWWTILMLTVGWLIGAVIAYAIGKYAGYPILKKLVAVDKLDKYHKKLPEDASFWIVLLFRLATPSEIISYFLGIIRYRFWHFFFATLISEFVFAVLTVYLSDAIVENKLLMFVGVILAILLISGGTYYLFYHIKKVKKSFKKIKKRYKKSR